MRRAVISWQTTQLAGFAGKPTGQPIAFLAADKRHVRGKGYKRQVQSLQVVASVKLQVLSQELPDCEIASEKS